MKKYILIILTIIINILTITKLNALAGYTTGTYVKVRSEASVNGAELAEIANRNTVLNLISDELYNVGDTNCSVGWYKINYNDKEGYICGKYVSIGELPSIDDGPGFNEETYEARINGVNIYVRKSASSSSQVLDTLLPGTNLKIVGNKVSGTGCTEGYYKVNYYKNQTGYVCSKFVVTKGEITSKDETYEQTLKSLGFPDSYIPYLVKLHQEHPTWTFKPILTNLYWSEVLDGFKGKTALLNYKIEAYLENLNDNIDGAGWYPAKSSVVAFYLDPRNFLTEKFVFMFESLRYDYTSSTKDSLNMENEITKKYLSTMSSVLSSSFLNTDEYKKYYVEAGFNFDINPVHLVTRSKGEGAANENYVAVSGNNPDPYCNSVTGECFNINNFYNFYNIGAYKQNGLSNPVKNGLLYACGPACGYGTSYGRPWDTREKAIKGGAEFISNRYIGKGQFTRYLQRYNVNPFGQNALYTNAYQTNVIAACSDSADAYTSYKEMNLLEEPYLFEIPVFLNMPDVVSLPNIASTVNTIESITINGKKITSFDKDILEFTVYVNVNDKEYDIATVLTDNTSKIEGTGKISFEEQSKTQELKVTAENGDVRIYKMTMVKVNDTTTVEEIISNLSVKVTGNIMHGISPGTLGSTLVTSINKFSPGTTVVLNEIDGNAASISGILKTGQTIKLTTPAGETKSFIISIIGDTSGDGEVTILDLLRVQKHLLGSSKLTDYNLVAGDTNADGEVTILDLLRIQKYILKTINL